MTDAPRSRAVEDFDAIKRRMEEIRRQEGRDQPAPPPAVEWHFGHNYGSGIG